MSMVGLFLIFYAFEKELKEIEKTPRNKLAEFFNEDYSVEEEKNKVKRSIKK